MKCPHFVGRHINYCRAYHKLMIPSIDETKAYCTAGEFNKCPVFSEYCMHTYSTQEELSGQVALEVDNWHLN